MEYLIDSVEGYKVRETADGLEVHDKNDNLVCELRDYTISEFKDEWGEINESELYDAIREEVDINEWMDKLSEMN